MKEYLEQGKPFAWRKSGLVFEPNIAGYTHGSHPCAVHYKDNMFVVAFTCRDSRQRSHVFLSYSIMSDNGVCQ